MPVVPIRSDTVPQQSSTIRPPSDTYLMMAAAQMHAEGRLVKSQPDTFADHVLQQQQRAETNLRSPMSDLEKYMSTHPSYSEGESQGADFDLGPEVKDPKVQDLQQRLNKRLFGAPVQRDI